MKTKYFNLPFASEIIILVLFKIDYNILSKFGLLNEMRFGFKMRYKYNDNVYSAK